MSNVVNLKPVVKAEYEDVCHWLRQMGDKGILAKESARQQISALKQLTGVLAEDEPKDVVSLLEHVDSLGARWAKLNAGNPRTVKRYIRRARISLEDFIEYDKDPAAFKPRTRAVAEKQPKRTKSKPATKKQVEQPVIQEAAPAIPTAHGMTQYEIPGTEKVFSYAWSEKPNMQDLPAVLFHLASITKDFDPTVVATMIMNMRAAGASTSTAIVASDD